MALIRDYELPGTGLIVSNAYHVVTKVDVEKRMADIEAPPDSSRPDGRTVGHKEEGKEVYWKAGYVGRIAVSIYKDAAARAENKAPLGFLGVNSSDNIYNASVGTTGMDHICKFFIDPTSEDNHITQAYKHLKTTDYYKDSVED